MYNTHTESFRATRKPEKENSTQPIYKPQGKMKAHSSYMTKQPAGGAGATAPNSARGGKLEYSTISHAVETKVINKPSLTRNPSTKSISLEKKYKNDRRLFNQTH